MSERASALSEAMLNEETERQLALWQVRYDTQQKEQQLLLQEQTIQAQKTHTIWLVALVIVFLLALLLLALYVGQLKRSKRMVEETSQIKDRYYTILSHDLRNPMVAQQQVLQMLCKTTTGEVNDSLKKLLASNGSQLELLGNLQELALLQLGKRKLMPMRLDLAGLINDTVANLKGIGELKDVSITTHVGRMLVSADRETMRVVLRNLLSNAIKFSHQGSTIEVGIVTNGFFVRDHGIGMSAEHVKKLLAPSSNRVLSAMGTSGENGTGIGLPLCLELVKMNNGHLTMESAINEGTTVTITLPAPNS